MQRNHAHWNDDDWENPASGLSTDDSFIEERDVTLSTVADVLPSGVTQEEIDNFAAEQNPTVDTSGNTIIGNTSKELGQISSELEMVDGKSEKLQTVTRTIVEQHDAITTLGQAAQAAQNTADTAVSDAAQANDRLGDILDSESQDPQALWRLQEAINEANEAALIAHSAAIEANTSAVAALNQEVARMLPCRIGQENDFIRIDEQGTLICKGSWTGWIYYMGGGSGTDIYRVAGETVTVRDRYLASSFGPVPTSTGGRTYSPSNNIDVIFMRVLPGTQTDYDVRTSSDWVWMDNASWKTLATFTVPEDGILTGTSKFCFVRKTYLGTYGARVTLNGQSVTKSNVISTAPLFGDGPRWANQVISVPKAKAGDVIKLEGYAQHGDANNRYVNQAQMDLSLITGRDS